MGAPLFSLLGSVPGTRQGPRPLRRPGLATARGDFTGGPGPGSAPPGQPKVGKFGTGAARGAVHMLCDAQGARGAARRRSARRRGRREPGQALPPSGSDPRTCREVESRPPAPAAYSTRRNASLRSAGSLLVNRRRVGGGTAWRPAARHARGAHAPAGCPGPGTPRPAATAPHHSPTRPVLASASGSGPTWLLHPSSCWPLRDPQSGLLPL